VCRIEKAPVQMNLVSKSLKLTMTSVELQDNISGALLRDLKTIVVNKFHPLVRRRFTAGHEIGHYILHKNKRHIDDLFFRTNNVSEDEKRMESEANQFAASLLMPRVFIDRELNGKKLTKNILQEISSKFKVSDQAMVFRLMNLGYLSDNILD